MTHNYATMTNGELRRLEADSSAPPDVWRAAVAEIASRERVGPRAADQMVPAVDRSTRIVIAGVEIRFWNMVRLLVQVALAAIPAMIILMIIGMLVFAAIRGTVLFYMNR